MNLSREERRRNRVIQHMIRFFDSPHEERSFALFFFSSHQIVQILKFCVKNPGAVEVLIRLADRRAELLKDLTSADVDAVKGYFDCKEIIGE